VRLDCHQFAYKISTKYYEFVLNILCGLTVTSLVAAEFEAAMWVKLMYIINRDFVPVRENMDIKETFI